MLKTSIGLCVIAILTGCGVVDDSLYVMSHSEQYYKQRGFTQVGYQGYNIWAVGRCYWFTLEKDGTIFQSCLLKWNDELHEYSLQAVNAIKGTSN